MLIEVFKKIKKRGFDQPPVFLAEDFVTAAQFGLEKAIGRGSANSTVFVFRVPRSIARAVGIDDDSRSVIGQDLGLPFVDVMGSSGFERIIHGSGQVTIFNGALLSKKVTYTTRRAR